MTLTIDFNDHLLFNLRQDSETVFFFISLIKTILEPDLFVHHGGCSLPYCCLYWLRCFFSHYSFNNGNRSEQSPIRSVIIRVIINRKTARWSVIFQARVWLQTQLDDTKSYWQSIITIINSVKKIQKISPIENLSKIKNLPFFKFPSFVG